MMLNQRKQPTAIHTRNPNRFITKPVPLPRISSGPPLTMGKPVPLPRISSGLPLTMGKPVPLQPTRSSDSPMKMGTTDPLRLLEDTNTLVDASSVQSFCTLTEITAQIQARIFELLNYIAPNYWTDPSRLIYSPSDDLAMATQIFKMQNGSDAAPNLQVPFAFFNRYTGEVVHRTYEHAIRPWDPWLGTHPGEPQGDPDTQVLVVPAILLYTLRIYDSNMGIMECLFDGLYRKGIRDKSCGYNYPSAVLNILSPYRIEIGNPKYDKTPTMTDRIAGTGPLYSILLPLECRCILGESEPAKRIYEINLTYNEPVTPPTIQIDGVVIDSNTPLEPDQNSGR